MIYKAECHLHIA